MIDPKRAVEVSGLTGRQRSFEDVEWDEIAPVLQKAVEAEAGDPATAVLGAAATGIARAANYLSRNYTLVVTNVPFLSFNRQADDLKRYIEKYHRHARHDLAAVFLDRWWMSDRGSSSVAVVWTCPGFVDGYGLGFQALCGSCLLS